MSLTAQQTVGGHVIPGTPEGNSQDSAFREANTDIFESICAVVDSSGNINATSASPAAAGSTVADATAMTAMNNTVTAADGTKGVLLPVAVANKTIVVINTNASNALKVYAVTGSQINALGSTVAYSVTPGQVAIFIARSATLWYTAAASDTITGLTSSADELNLLTDATADFTGVSPIVYCHIDSASLSEINAGHTLLAAVAGRTVTVVDWSMTAVGGAAGTATAVTLSDTAGSPVLIATVAVAALVEGTVVKPNSANVTDGAAGVGLGLTAEKGITIEKTGSALDTLSDITITIHYTIA